MPVKTQSIEERVKRIIIKQLVVDKELVTPQASFINDLGADSLDTAELIMEFEDAFEIDIPDEDAEKMLTVGDVAAYIKGAYTRKMIGSSMRE